MSRPVSLCVRVCGAVLLGLAVVGTPLPAVAQSLPSGWATRDIGSVGATGSASGSGASFTVNGAGADIWDAADALHFTARTMTGNGSIVAQVSTIEQVNAWT